VVLSNNREDITIDRDPLVDLLGPRRPGLMPPLLFVVK